MNKQDPTQQTHRSHWPLSLLGGGVSLFNLMLPLVLVRILSPDDVGKYKIFFLYVALVPLFCMTGGIVNGLAHWAGHAAKRVRAFRTSWTLLSSTAIAALIVGLALQNQLANALGWQPREAQLFILGGIAFLLGGFFEEATVASGKIWRGAWFNSGFELARGATILAFALIFRNITAIFAAYVLVMSLKVALGVSWGAIQGFQRPVWDPEMIRAVARYSLPVSLSAALSIISGYSDQIVLSRTLSASDFAVYSLGCLLVPPLIIFEQSVNRVLIPRMSSDFAEGRSGHARYLFREAVSELSWLLMPAAVGTMLFAPQIVDLLFTTRYASAAHYLRIFAVYHLVNLIPYDVVARARGNGRWIFNQIALFSVLTLATIYPAVHYFGPTGALVDMAMMAALLRVVSIAWVHRRERWPLAKMLPWPEWGRYLAAAGLGTLAALALRPWAGPGLRWFATGAAAFTVTYFLATLGTVLRRRAQVRGQPHVLLLTQYLGLGGLERMILNLARGLQADGHWAPSVFVYDSLRGDSPTLHGEFERSGIPVTTMTKSGGLSPRVVARIAVLVIREKTLVIHSHDLGALIYAVFAKWATLGAVRVVHTQHSFIHLERSPKYKHYERFFSRFADRITTVSESLKTLYPAVGVDAGRVAVVPNGIDFLGAPAADTAGRLAARQALAQTVGDSEAARLLRTNAECVWVLCMARVHPKKGQEHVVRLWAGLPPEVRAKAMLVFVGAETSAGALEKLQARIDAVSSPARAVYAGFALEPQQWLRACDVFVSGSEFEGMPLGPLEAAGSGLDTLVSDIPGHSMLPPQASKFDLVDSHIGVEKLAQAIERAKVGSTETRRAAWDSVSGLRTDFGIAGMTRRYVAHYAVSLSGSSYEEDAAPETGPAA